MRREGNAERPLGKKAARTRAQLLAAAYQTFVAKGYRGASVADIAEAAGVSLGTFYQYFRDRADVMAAVVGVGVASLRGDGRQRWEPERGRLGLRRMIAAFVEQYAETAAFHAVWEEVTRVDREMAALHRQQVRELNQPLADALADAAAKGLVRRDLDHDATATALTAMVDRYCYLTYVLQVGDEPQPVDDAIDVLTSLWADAIGLVDGSRRRR